MKWSLAGGGRLREVVTMHERVDCSLFTKKHYLQVHDVNQRIDL